MYRQLQLISRRPSGRVRDTVVTLFEGTKKLPDGYRRIDSAHQGVLSAAMKRAEFSAKRGAVTVLYPTPNNPKGSRLIVVGLGTPNGSVASALRDAAAKLLLTAAEVAVTRLDLQLTAGLAHHLGAEAIGQAVGEGLSLANFKFDEFKGLASEAQPRRNAKHARLELSAERPLRAGLQRGLSIGQSTNLARRYAATPPNVANVRYLVRSCRNMARQLGLRCTVVDAPQAARLKMGGLLAVGAAGSTPPALICLEHRPARVNKKTRPILLVGKAVTFDTGGYSIKSAAGMEGMKYDKCGGMAVIGAMDAIARLKLPVPVVGIIAAAENLIDQKAFRPGDIIKMYNGVTVEVTNTDAEGRLVLADALAYGNKRYRPQAVIDLATLTGGVVVALGSYCAGAFCNDGPLRDRLISAGESTGERLWCLPLWQEHRRQLRSAHADIVNSAGRDAHPIQGAAFLSHFVDAHSAKSLPKTPWVHLDIAGVSDVKTDDAPLYGKGPTGFGVRLLVKTIESWLPLPV